MTSECMQYENLLSNTYSEQANDASLVINHQGQVVALNPAAKKLYRAYCINNPANKQWLRATLMQGFNEINTGKYNRIQYLIPTNIGSMPGQHLNAHSITFTQCKWYGQALTTIWISYTDTPTQTISKLLPELHAMHHTDAAIYLTDRQSKIIFISQGFTSLTGYNTEDVKDKTPCELFHPQAIESVLTPTEHHHQNHPHINEVKQLSLPNSKKLWVRITDTPIFNHNQQLTARMGVITDITDYKVYHQLYQQTIDSLLHAEPLPSLLVKLCELIEDIFPDTSSAIYQLGEDNYLHLLAGPRMPHEFIAQLLKTPIGANEGSSGTCAFTNTTIAVTDIATHPLWKKYRHLAKQTGVKASWSTPVCSVTGKVLGVFAFYFRQCTQPNALQNEIAQICTRLCAVAFAKDSDRENIWKLAFYDTLTGLPNRHFLFERSQQLIQRAAEKHNQLTMLFIDLDHFKAVNDSWGHSIGDKLLCFIADKLKSLLGKRDIVGRLSGDEFLIVIDQADPQNIDQLADRLRQAICNPCQLADVILTPQLSIGISQYPQDGQTLSELMHHADMAMYHAKQTSKKRMLHAG
jgi:diguanylate cyclase (GGDEF)-like protein/PAS domain S-box-containing protein